MSEQERMKMKRKTKAVKRSGWVIVHPGGYMELDYFNVSEFHDKYTREVITPTQWLEAYRPNCSIHRVQIVIQPNEKGQP